MFFNDRFTQFFVKHDEILTWSVKTDELEYTNRFLTMPYAFRLCALVNTRTLKRNRGFDRPPETFLYVENTGESDSRHLRHVIKDHEMRWFCYQVRKDR